MNERTYLRSVDRHVGTESNRLDAASLKELTDELTCEGTTNLVGFNEGEDGNVLALLSSTIHSTIEKGLVEDDAVILLLTKLGLGPLLLLTLTLTSGLSGKQLGCLGLLNLGRL